MEGVIGKGVFISRKGGGFNDGALRLESTLSGHVHRRRQPGRAASTAVTAPLKVGDNQRCILRLGASWNFSTRGRTLRQYYKNHPEQRPVGPLRGGILEMSSKNPAPSGEIPRSR